MRPGAPYYNAMKKAVHKKSFMNSFGLGNNSATTA
jgi:hypothetical protein